MIELRWGSYIFKYNILEKTLIKEPDIELSESILIDVREFRDRLKAIDSHLITLSTSTVARKLIIIWRDDTDKEYSIVISKSYVRRGVGEEGSYNRRRLSKVLYGRGYVMVEYGSGKPLKITYKSGMLRVWLAPLYTK